MTRAAWVTARLLLFPLSIYPVPRPARLLCAAPRLNLEVRTPLLRCSDLESRRSRGLRLLSLFVPPTHLRVPYRECSVGCLSLAYVLDRVVSFLYILPCKANSDDTIRGDNKSSSKGCVSWNLGKPHQAKHVDDSGMCRFRHACDQFVSDKGPGGQCLGSHKRKDCDYDPTKRVAKSSK